MPGPTKAKGPFLNDDEILSSIPFSTVNQDLLVMYPQDSNLDLLEWLKKHVAASTQQGAADVNFALLRTRFIKDEAGDTKDLELLVVTTDNKYIQLQVKLWFMGEQSAVVGDLIRLVHGQAGDRWTDADN